MTLVSKILEPESGFNDPWNVSTFPVAKMGCSGFSMQSLAEKSLQGTPRYTSARYFSKIARYFSKVRTSAAERSLQGTAAGHPMFPQYDLLGRSFYQTDHPDQSF